MYLSCTELYLQKKKKKEIDALELPLLHGSEYLNSLL